MSGPSVTTGPESRQDYQTDPLFMEAVKKRFGPIGFDLAAHAGNTQHARYFAPTEFVTTGTLTEISLIEFRSGVIKPLLKKGKQVVKKSGELVYQKIVENKDPAAYGFDCFKHSWSKLAYDLSPTKVFAVPPRLLLWLNCEFDDVDRYAARCKEEASKGAEILLLTPMGMTKWFINHILNQADSYFLCGRLCFDGRSPYPKDCMLTHFSPLDHSHVHIWDWRKDKILWESPSEHCS
jgi:hypothetical protein